MKCTNSTMNSKLLCLPMFQMIKHFIVSCGVVLFQCFFWIMLGSNENTYHFFSFKICSHFNIYKIINNQSTDLQNYTLSTDAIPDGKGCLQRQNS